MRTINKQMRKKILEDMVDDIVDLQKEIDDYDKNPDQVARREKLGLMKSKMEREFKSLGLDTVTANKGILTWVTRKGTSRINMSILLKDLGITKETFETKYNYRGPSSQFMKVTPKK